MSILDDLEKEFEGFSNLPEKRKIKYLNEQGKKELDEYNKQKKKIFSNGEIEYLRNAAKDFFLAGKSGHLRKCLKEMEKCNLSTNEIKPYKSFLNILEEDKTTFKERAKYAESPILM